MLSPVEKVLAIGLGIERGLDKRYASHCDIPPPLRSLFLTHYIMYYAFSLPIPTLSGTTHPTKVVILCVLPFLFTK